MLMATPCQHCGFVNEPDATFCGSCGAFLVVVVMPSSTRSDQALKTNHDADRTIEPDTARRQHLESTHDAGDTTVVQMNDDRYVFVSYSRVDQAYVDELCGWLRRRGVVVWIDSDIDYGTRWQTVVKDRLDAAVAVLVVMTPAAEESRWVGREVHRAEARGKPIFPLLLDGTPFFGLSDLQHEDVSGGRPPTDRFIDRLRRCCQP
jgi:TIR domain